MGLVETAAAADLDDSWVSLVERVRADIRSQLVPEQLALFEDECRYRVACCARQCGKTFTVARLLIDTALAGPDRICVYVSDTWNNAVKTMWVDQEDGLPAVLALLGLSDDRNRGDFAINLTTKTITFRNGSIVELAGADRDAWSNFRGRKIDLLVADEMQRQEQEHLRRALKKDVPDCLMRRRGSFVGIGTVGLALTGIWFELNAANHKLCPPTPGWTAHHWTAQDLQHITNVWAEQLAWAEAMNIDRETDSEWLREKLGLWVRDEQSLVHSVTEACLWDGGPLPDLIRTRCPQHGHVRGRCGCQLPYVGRTQPQVVIAGLDLGAGDGSPNGGDPSAVVVLSVSPEEWIIRELYSEQRFCPGTDQLAEWLRGVQDTYGVRRFYVDPAWKLTGNDLSRLHGLPVEPAIKGDAEGTTEDLWHMERSTAMRQGTMLAIRGSTLHRQLESVQRDLKELERGHIRAAPAQDDHVYDSWRYAFRMLRTRHAAAPEFPMTAEQRQIAKAVEDREHRLGLRKGTRDWGRDGR